MAGCNGVGIELFFLCRRFTLRADSAAPTGILGVGRNGLGGHEMQVALDG
jgi:hypothetical protein